MTCCSVLARQLRPGWNGQNQYFYTLKFPIHQTQLFNDTRTNEFYFKFLKFLFTNQAEIVTILKFKINQISSDTSPSNRAVQHPALPLICVQMGQSDWSKSHLCPKWLILIGQMRFRELTTQDVGLLYMTRVQDNPVPPIVYRVVVIDTFLGVGLQKVCCKSRYLLSYFFPIEQFIPNFGNLFNLISYATSGYFRSYLLKLLFMYFFCIHVDSANRGWSLIEKKRD